MNTRLFLINIGKPARFVHCIYGGVYYTVTMNKMTRKMFNNNRIEVTRYGILSAKAPEEICIAHLSDLHEKEFGQHNRRLFKKVAGLTPDIIAITGDLVAHENQKQPPREYVATLAHELSGIAPTFFVTGNHERSFDMDICAALNAGGVVVVREDVHTLRIRGTQVNITGMDDLSYGTTELEFVAHALPLEGVNVFLTHRPEVFPLLLGKGIDLVLAGHTHAGQIRIPGVSKLYMQGQGFLPKYMQGEFTDGHTTMIISRGLGASGYPTFRINNPPDLVAVYVSPLEPGCVPHAD